VQEPGGNLPPDFVILDERKAEVFVTEITNVQQTNGKPGLFDGEQCLRNGSDAESSCDDDVLTFDSSFSDSRERCRHCFSF
jgi:hypothetical protein